MMTVDELFKLHGELTAEAYRIMQQKNHDYRGGTEDPFANFRDAEGIGVNPILGIMMRMRDKQQRIRAFVETGKLLVKGEGVKDAILDQINYLVLMYGMIKEQEQESTE